MRWDLEAVAKLREYTARKAALTSIPAEIKRLEDDCGRIRSATADSSPVQGGGNAREDMLLSNICLRVELKQRLADTKSWLRSMDDALEQMDDEERLVLDRFYITPHKGSVERLCEELHIEKTAAYTRKNKALRKFTMILYGAVES